MAQARVDLNLDGLNPRGRLHTLLLYCPFDRKVTRHARRGNELRLVCLDCGRSLDQEPGETQSASTIDLTVPVPEAPVQDLPRRAVPLERSPAHLPAQLRALPLERRRTPVPAQEPRAAAPRRSGRHSSPTSPRRLLLVAAAAVLVALGGANLLGQVVRSAQTSAPPAAVRAATEAAGPSVMVANTEGIGVYLRASPKMDDFLHPVADGTELQIAGPDVWADGIHWLPVEDGSGNRGWVPAAYTSLAS